MPLKNFQVNVKMACLGAILLIICQSSTKDVPCAFCHSSCLGVRVGGTRAMYLKIFVLSLVGEGIVLIMEEGVSTARLFDCRV